MGDAQARQPGSYYPVIDTAIPGTHVCEHLSHCAAVLDRFNLIHTMQHEVIDEHAAATNRMHTGRPTSGTIVYPAIGSIVAHQRGAVAEGVPAYVLIGYPKVTRGAWISGVTLQQCVSGRYAIRPQWSHLATGYDAVAPIAPRTSVEPGASRILDTIGSSGRRTRL